MPNPITQRFAGLRTTNRRALVCYLTAGHPDEERSIELLRGVAGAGADVIEVGIPFSDPLADGPVIQASSQQALAHGMTFDRALALIAKAGVAVPVIIFSYLNPLLAAGPDALKRAAAAGASGVLVTDLPVGADPQREKWLGESHLAFIRLVAPTTPSDRMSEIARHGSGFVYLISRLGVTGARAELPPELPGTVARLRAATTLPICVGFGIARPEHAAAIGRVADGVVVGSALVEAAGRSVDAAVAFTHGIRRGLDATI
ncbi:MAG: tryptophan synthase subunit alpha [Gemmatimonadales bacterium]